MLSAQKYFLRAFLPAMATFLAAAYLSTVWLRNIASTQLRLAVALLPVIPAVWVMYAVVLRIRGLDELQRRIELEAAMIASLLVGMASFAVGFLVEAHVVQVSIIAVFPTMIGAYALAQTWVAWRYR